MNITLVNPKGKIHGKRELNASLLYVGTVLYREGHNVDMVDSQIEETDGKFKALIHHSDMVGFTVMTDQVKDALRMSDMAKEIDPSVPIVWGGIHPTLYPEQTIQDKSIDFVVIGEGENPARGLASYICGKAKLEDIKGIAYKNNGNVTINPAGDYIDLNELSPPEWNLLDMKEYIQDFSILGQPLGRMLPIHTGRGCPYSCRFCINLLTNKWRPLNARNIVNEVNILNQKYDLGYINFIDDNFFLDRNRVEQMSRMIISEGIDIKWQGCCRANYFNDTHVNDGLMELAKESGCTALAIGIESGSQRILDMLDKRITLDQIMKATNACKRYDMFMLCSFMIGLPGEERDDMIKTLNLIKKITEYKKAYILGPQVYRPYPGCSLYEEVRGMFKAPNTLREWAASEMFEGYASPKALPWITEPKIAENAWFYIMRSLSKSTAQYPFRKMAQFRLDNNLFGFNIDRKLFEFGKRLRYGK